MRSASLLLLGLFASACALEGPTSIAPPPGVAGRAMLVAFRLHFDPRLFDPELDSRTAFAAGNDSIILINTSGTPFPQKWQFTQSSEIVTSVNTSYSFIFGVRVDPRHPSEVLRLVTLPAYLCGSMIGLRDHRFPEPGGITPTAITGECQAVPPEFASMSAEEALRYLPNDTGAVAETVDLTFDTLVRNETSTGTGEKTVFLDLGNFERYVYSVR